MSAIRPLATIAVLAALGVFLALKINEQPPVALNDEALQPWASSLGEATGASEAPAFDASQMSLSPRTAPQAGGLEEAPSFAAPAPIGPTTPPTTSEPLPDLPPLPALPGTEINSPPPLAPAAPPIVEAPPTVTPEQDLQLPESIPTARYNEQAAAPVGAAPGVSGRVPSLGASTGDLAPPTPPKQPESPFDAAWPLIQAALDRDELTRAHQLLSQWRAEPTLTAVQRADVNVLLDDLAGSVVYSTDHRLEPPHTVRAGETLKNIADQYGVSWRLLGKINGVSRPEDLQPGQVLKVLRGPFTGEVSLANQELVLMLDGRYAGRFPVQVDGLAADEGMWRVDAKTTTVSHTPRLVLRGAGGAVSLDDSPVADPAYQGRITVAARDANDLNDILSVGSTVTIRR